MYDARQEAIKQMMAQALALRQGGNEMPQGQMVSGRYIAPSMFQNLAPAVSQAGGIYKQQQAQQAQQQLEQEMEQAATQWMRERPQPTQQAMEYNLPPDQMGPVGMDPTQTRTVVPTQQQNLEWAQRGTQNPLTKSLAAAYGADMLIKEPEREEARAFRVSEAQKQRDQQREIALQRNETMQQYYTGILQNQQTSNEQKAEAARVMQELKKQELELKRERLEFDKGKSIRDDTTKRYGIDEKAKANRSKMSAKQISDLDEADALHQGIDHVLGKLNDPAAKESGSEAFARAAAGKAAGVFGLDQTTVSNVGRSDDVKNARQMAADLSGGIKHGRYGAALSAGERADAAQYLVTEWDGTPEITRKLNGLKELMALNNRRLKLMEDGGVSLDEAQRAIQSQRPTTPKKSDLPIVEGGKVTIPPGESEPTFSPSAAKQLLKPGTKFKGTDGNYYVR